MANKKGRMLLASVVYYILFGMTVCSEPTQEEMNELCKGNNFNEPIPYPYDPKHFIICVANKGYLGSCENCFDISTGECGACPENEICTGKRIGDRVDRPEDKCQKYYVCMGDGKVPTHVACPPNQHYSTTDQKCTSPLEADCLPLQQWCEKKQDGLRFVAPKCYQYYECSQQKSYLKTCPHDQYFEMQNSTCVRGVCVDQDDSTSEREPKCSDYAEGVKIAHAKCYKFYVCLNSATYVGQCATGYYFNIQSKSCVEDVNDQCNDD